MRDRQYRGLTRRRSSCSHFVTGSRIAVDGINSPLAPHKRRDGDGHITSPGSDVHASPTGPETEALKRSRERASVDVVSEIKFGHGFRVVVTLVQLVPSR